MLSAVFKVSFKETRQLKSCLSTSPAGLSGTKAGTKHPVWSLSHSSPMPVLRASSLSAPISSNAWDSGEPSFGLDLLSQDSERGLSFGLVTGILR